MNMSSVKEAPPPAPLSTVTVHPSPVSFLTVSGDAAQRRSFSIVAFGTAIFKVICNLLVRPQKLKNQYG
jgi:hypothetical protein